jgi:hypothetical protein
MKTFTIQTRFAAAIIAGTLGLSTVWLTTAKADDNGPRGLTGSGEAVATFVSPPPGFPPTALLTDTFFADGNVLLTPNLPNVTPAQGSYVRVDRNTYVYTVIFFSVNPAGGLLTKSRIVATLNLADDSNSYLTNAKLQALDSNNNVLSTLNAVIRAKRLSIVTSH